MLRVSDLHVNYGPVAALRGVDLAVDEGQLVTVIGPNGAGKSSLLLAIMGVVRAMRGAISFLSEPVLGQPPERIVRLGVSMVPENREIFSRLNVRENLLIGAVIRTDDQVHADLTRVQEYFPILRERSNQPAGQLSGGEQQMLAIARALMSRPRLLLLDEPSLGLAPTVVDRVYAIIGRLRREGVTILLVEQNARRAFQVCDRALLMNSGKIVAQGSVEELRAQHSLDRIYLGGAAVAKLNS
jgi:branched-chain amino acid transport system ATP-binding protein